MTADKHRVCGTQKAVQMTYRDALDPDVRVQREAVGRGVVSRQLGSEAKHRHALLQIVARYHSAQGLDGVQVLVGLSHTRKDYFRSCVRVEVDVLGLSLIHI